MEIDMKKIIRLSKILLGWLILLQCNAIGQTPATNLKQNQLYLELGGNSLVYSISYERIISENFTIRGGFGITPGIIFAEGTFIHIPFTISYLIGGERHKLESGLGVTYFAGTDVEIFGLPAGDQSLIFLTGIVGYRYISPSGFVLRIFFTPLYSSESEPNFNPYGGLSFGFML